MEAAEIKAISGRINRLLPDDGKEAVTALALAYANVVVATGCDDARAVEAVRVALNQMRAGGWHRHS